MFSRLAGRLSGKRLRLLGGAVLGGGAIAGMSSTASAQAASVRVTTNGVTITVSGDDVTISDAVDQAPETPAPLPTAQSACRPIVICGPSGAGKSTLIKSIMAKYPGEFGFSVSHTTRGPRPGEVEGVDYHFRTMQEMEAAVSRGEFLEHAVVHGNMYGTSKEAVGQVAEQCKVCFLDIDVQGVKTVQEVAGSTDIVYIFVQPPSIDALEKRLRGRGTETEAKIQKRVQNAAGEIEQAQTMHFDARIVNDNLQEAIKQFEEIVSPVRCKCSDFRRAVAEQ